MNEMIEIHSWVLFYVIPLIFSLCVVQVGCVAAKLPTKAKVAFLLLSFLPGINMVVSVLAIPASLCILFDNLE